MKISSLQKFEPMNLMYIACKIVFINQLLPFQRLSLLILNFSLGKGHMWKALRGCDHGRKNRAAQAPIFHKFVCIFSVAAYMCLFLLARMPSYIYLRAVLVIPSLLNVTAKTHLSYVAFKSGP